MPSLESLHAARLSDEERIVWDRTPHRRFRADELDLLVSYCRHTAAADSLSKKILAWDEMDPLSELQTLYAMRDRESAAAGRIAKQIGAAIYRSGGT